MKPDFFLLHMSCYIYIHFFILTLVWFGPNRIVALELGNQTDHLALLQFKQLISSDPYGILGSWNSSNHFCKWHGITCSPMRQRVTRLTLRGSKLHGSISPYIGNLSHLRYLNLGNNIFFGNIPQELGCLSRLRYLILVNNSFVGEFPINLTKCFELKSVYLAGNNLIGEIPSQIGSLQKLQSFYVGRNNLSGKIPSSIRNLTSLSIFSISFNNLEGNFPNEMCFLKKLKAIAVQVNKLSGTFLSCLYNMSSLKVISTAANEFSGSLPPNLFHTLPNLRYFAIGGNQFSGPIPTSIANASILAIFDISENHFVGQVPSLGKLQSLLQIYMAANNLGYNSTKDLEFLKSLTNCSKLQSITLFGNNFGGSLPSSVGNLSTTISQLNLGSNQIHGKIPTELGNLINLSLLNMIDNLLEGTIPTTFGKFQMMQKLIMVGNRLSGNIPFFIGNLTQLYGLGLDENMLEGNIPPNIGNCRNLQYLGFAQNNLRGVIPSEILSISSLTNFLDLSRNSLSGSLPKEVGTLKNINWLDVSENHLSGVIPETIGECISLEYLNLKGNSFEGIISSSLASLKGLEKLDLSRNHLSGPIPKVLQNLSILEYFNVSFNMLEGEVPIEGVFRNASGIVVIGNNKLCGGISELHLPPCPVKSTKPAKNHKFVLKVVIISVVVCILLLAFIPIVYWIRKRNKKQSSDSPPIDQLAKISYKDLHQGTDGFSDRNLIGSGSFGSVYKGRLVAKDKDVAVKVLKLQKKEAQKSFIAECNALKSIRHRNLIKILTCCSSIDYKGQEFKALVFDYMTNGSLEEWLHPRTGNVELLKTLDLRQRLNMIIDVASALHYLHRECEQMIVHCDLKPSNILLDDDMVAHVSDFGIAKLVSSIDVTSREEISTIGIKGTIGYTPPEYGMDSKVSTYGDMYSFGIVILEMLTGKRPTDEMFRDGQNMHNFVATSFPDNLAQILDKHIVPRDEEATIEDRNTHQLMLTAEKLVVSLIRIGLACSMESPNERMNIIDVTRELNIIRKDNRST
ncbi:probable LRR receptor-like serine/threonine-protein kinase At3g47570 [Vicia villosa]|uniref:probable LRR receptor-like serine/threonine-protein kinase At3g47570 n=1 Tax=Vicia villosa TaxID=3911 RepID=UPI00273BD394|nr:probable LRR receptor-like serine/threonine-protein kinase At3g47570 [Vicia villosa]